MSGGAALLALHSLSFVGCSVDGIHRYSNRISKHFGYSKVCKVFIAASSQRNSSKKRKRLKSKGSLLRTRPDNGSDNEADICKTSADLQLADNVKVEKNISSKEEKTDEIIPTRERQRADIMRACVLTSAIFAVIALIVRQVSHIAAEEGFPFPDCSQLMPYSIGWSQAEILFALVLSISTLRQFLLKLWPEFSESSHVANQMVLEPLESTWDIVIISVLSGVSEELLFRGALLPLIGLNWIGVMVSSIIFGTLHLGAGRKSAFAIWASFVGIIYGTAAISSSSLVVPMTAHSMNNLIGGLVWRYLDAQEK